MMNKLEDIVHCIREIKRVRPLIHQITNFVTANDCANVTLAIGASPVMTSDPSEVEEMVCHARALVLNIGTLQARSLEAMLLAGKKAASLGIPVIFDPVGVGATKMRTAAAAKIIKEVPLAVIRGNMSEIKVLAGIGEGIKGVDSIAGYDGAQELAGVLSKQLNAVIAITGPVDIIASGDSVTCIHNGHPMMASITGTGCMATALTGCCAAVSSPYIAALTGITIMGIAGELAHNLLRIEEGEGLGSYRVRLIDAISNMIPERIEDYVRLSETT